MTRPRKGAPARLNMELDAVSKKRLDRLKETTDAASLTEVVRRALRFYDVVAGHKGTVVLKGEDGTEKELLVL